MLRTTKKFQIAALAAVGLSSGCGSSKPIAASAATSGLTELSRADFNRLAVRANAAVYWRADTNQNGALDPDEVVTLRFYPDEPTWTLDGKFTPEFLALYQKLLALASAPAVDDERLRLVGMDLDAGRATLVETDASALPADHQAFLREMLAVADLIDQLYDTQTGVRALPLPPGGLDDASASLLRRNRGPRCASAALLANPSCTALPDAPKPWPGVYPTSLQADSKFCDTLAARDDAEALLGDFTAIVLDGTALKAVPYSEYFAEPMSAIAVRLEAAAASLTDPAEGALRIYLTAAAAAFRNNDWAAADEAWAKMNAHNSRWYVRVAPDESYWEPCVRKAGFHLTLALINPGSLQWQRKLSPIQQDLETELARRAGAPYQARQVNFGLPDFIDIVINAGDDRGALGATVGQSLPNVGPVAEGSRGRTVVMANLYRDPDSRTAELAQAASLLDAASFALVSDDQTASQLGTILHEACHNFGPSAEYRPVATDGTLGPTDNEAFGGPVASIMEELKAQTCGLWLVEQLRTRKLLSDELAMASYVDGVLWAMSQVGQGMTDSEGNPNTYPQLAAVQLGFWLSRGAITFSTDAVAANGKDVGAFTIHADKIVDAIEKLTGLVGNIKARAATAMAKALIEVNVDGEIVPHQLLRERVARLPRANFVYSIRAAPKASPKASLKAAP